MTIISFCACCGVRLEAGLGQQEEPTCPNCGAPVKERSTRIEGEFEDSEAAKFEEIC